MTISRVAQNTGIMKNDLVSVIIPAYNCEKYINRCIDGILNQDYPFIEIIVVYDESNDRTLEFLKDYDSRIRIICQNKTSPAIARNVGIEKANGNIIAFCDADDYSISSRIRIQLQKLKESGTQATYSDFFIADENGKTIRDVVTPEWNRNAWLFNNFICFSSMMVTSKAIMSMKYSDGCVFDQCLPAFEDYDFLIRLSKNYSLIRTPFKLSYYSNNPHSLGKRYQRMVMLKPKILLKNKLFFHFFISGFLETPIKLGLITLLRQ